MNKIKIKKKNKNINISKNQLNSLGGNNNNVSESVYLQYNTLY